MYFLNINSYVIIDSRGGVSYNIAGTHLDIIPEILNL